MAKHKLQRFAELETFPNVFQKEQCPFKGTWHNDYFKNQNPIVLELGCGRGEYTVNLANFFPEKNFIGIDIKGARLWRGAKTAIEQNKSNMAFIRTQIEQIGDYFTQGEVSEIWITFPDPQPNKAKKRLTSPEFLARYQQILAPNALLHLKTDNDMLYEYTLEVLQEKNMKVHKHTPNLYQSEILDEVLSIKTTYEAKFLAQGKNINYIQFSW